MCKEEKLAISFTVSFVGAGSLVLGIVYAPEILVGILSVAGALAFFALLWYVVYKVIFN